MLDDDELLTLRKPMSTVRAGAQSAILSAQTAPGTERLVHQKRVDRCEQQLVGVEAVPALGRIRPVDAIAIELPGRDVVEIAVPDVLVALGQFDPLELAATLAVEQAKLDLLRIGREQRKVGAPSVPACA